MNLLDRKNIRTILFDLDGTLLQVEMQEYIPNYVASLVDRLKNHSGAEQTSAAIFSAISALIRRDSGETSNETFFFQHIADLLDLDRLTVADSFGDFFTGDLSHLDPLMQPLALAGELVEQSLRQGLEVVIATNPVFPRAVVEARLARAGLAQFDFRLVTCFENCRRCKPNPDYFADLLDTLDLNPNDCLMVGNDTEHDLAARKIGIPTFLVDTWLIDRCRGQFETDLRGDHSALLDYIVDIGKLR